MNLQLEGTIQVGDILTSLTIFVSVLGLVLSLAKDRRDRLTEQASKVRGASANALVKLDRWQAVQLSLYQELQPTFVELSEELTQEYDVVRVRDQFWKKVNLERTRVARQVFDEHLGTAYSEIISHFPAARAKFVEAFTKLTEVENSVANRFLTYCEKRILALKNQQATYQTAILGNALREEASRQMRELSTKSEAVILPVREYLFAVIAMPDSKIVRASSAQRTS